jgi:hypothetical protein
MNDNIDSSNENFDDGDLPLEIDGKTKIGDPFRSVFIIPLSSPLPTELEDSLRHEGTLLARLQPLASKETQNDIELVAISGAELSNLARSWHLLVEAKKCFALMELPGARYDVLFKLAIKQIGLRTYDWPSLEAEFVSRSKETQRTKDAEPWNSKEQAKETRQLMDSNLSEIDQQIEEPSEDTIDEYSPGN